MLSAVERRGWTEDDGGGGTPSVLASGEDFESEATRADEGLVAAALRRDAGACRQLVRRLTPIVQRRVGRRCEHASRQGGALLERSRVLDLTQEVLVLLFDRDGAVLRSWDPARGLSLDNFVGLVAEREAAAILRSGRRSAWAEMPTASELIDVGGQVDATEERVSSRNELTEIWHRLERELSPRGLALFEALCLEQRSIEEVSVTFEMTASALYAFRSRVRGRLERIRSALAQEPSGSRS